jgi:hypothetical protein
MMAASYDAFGGNLSTPCGRSEAAMNPDRDDE